MDTGVIKFFNAAKGFGFVTPDGGGADLFLPAAAVTAAGVSRIKPGQRVTFEQAPDTKGPKVVSLKLVGEPAKTSAPAAGGVTVFCDASSDATADIVEAVRGSGFSLTIQDYVAAPPGIDYLKRLSQMISVCGQSLVRRYDPLFLALQLDDRFITDQDFWTAIVEHPALINGPVLITSGQARICRTASEARAFLRQDEMATASKPKTLSPRIAAMLRGEAVPRVEEPVPAAPAVPPAERKSSSEKKEGVAAKPAPKSKPAAKPASKIVTKSSASKASKKKAVPKKAGKSADKPKKRSRK